MKKSILTIAFGMFLISISVVGCKSPKDKVEDAENKVMEAHDELDAANLEYLVEIEEYKKEISDKIAANKQSINDFNNRKSNLKAEAKADYNKRIAELEQKNNDMQKRMDDYKAEGKENWNAFKIEFGRDMDELGKSFSDFFSKSK